ncbi:hypothetical protein TEA_005317 [Camellia sinensis var. sinensis]|uniref:HMG box domain-containing protein n=1 Tax=Camellia sinensis var. sinensis TaxID=542762 RepID=A0A4S4EFY5_CAMSN|nr:hypothetical protein TEA_005317 [Camellia sinensis var. sinensis]
MGSNLGVGWGWTTDFGLHHESPVGVDGDIVEKRVAEQSTFKMASLSWHLLAGRERLGVVCPLKDEDVKKLHVHGGDGYALVLYNLACLASKALFVGVGVKRGGLVFTKDDEDFVADRDDGGSPTDDSGEEESDASDSGGEKEKPAKKESKKEPSTSKAASSRGKSKDGDEDGSKKRKQKKKKDPNAPKRALSGFMFFSQSERENIKKINPGIAFTDVGRVLGDKWKKMTAAEKEPYEAKAQADKKRYKDEISGYKNPQPMNIDSGNESDSA